MNPAMSGRWRVVGRYFTVAAPGYLTWEFGHMPLYTLWETAGGAVAVE